MNQKGPACRQAGFTPIIFLVGILILAGVAGEAYYFLKIRPPQQKACTMEAKICPDGTSVGRTGPNCEFAACPGATRESTGSAETANWKTYTNSNYGYSIMYPADILINDAEVCSSGFADDPDNNLVLFRKHAGKYYCGSDEPYYFSIIPKKTNPPASNDSCLTITKESISIDGAQAEKQTTVFITSKECINQGIGPLFNKFVQILLLNKNNQELRIQYGTGGINKNLNESVFTSILSTFKFIDQTQTNPEGKGCGGFAGETGDAACPTGYKCQYPQPHYPDGQGKCVKKNFLGL